MSFFKCDVYIRLLVLSCVFFLYLIVYYSSTKAVKSAHVNYIASVDASVSSNFTEKHKSQERDGSIERARQYPSKQTEYSELEVAENDGRKGSYGIYGTVNAHDVPDECKPKDCRTYLWVFMGHSGSSAMESIIKRAGGDDVWVPGFEPLQEWGTHNKEDSMEYKCRMALHQTREYFEKGTAEGKLTGFKLRPYHLHRCGAEIRRGYSDLMKEFDTCLIWNYRVNMVESDITDMREKTLKVTQFHSDGTDLETSLELDDDQIRTIVEYQMGDLNWGGDIDDDDWSCAEATGQARGYDSGMHDNVACTVLGLLRHGGYAPERGLECALHVAYEDFLYSQDATLTRIGRFLGIDDANMHQATSRFEKASASGICHQMTEETFARLCLEMAKYPELQWLMVDPINDCVCPSID